MNPLQQASGRPVTQEVLDRFQSACESGDAKAVKAMLDAGVPADLRLATSQALHVAAAACQPQICRLLVDRGAPVDALDDSGHRPMDYVAFNGMQASHLDTAMALLELGAHFDSQGPLAAELLYGACKHRAVEAALTLLDRGVDPNARGERGIPAFHVALQGGPLSINLVSLTERMLELGAQVNGCDAHGVPALHRAAQHGQTAAVHWLVDCGAAVDAVDSGQRTALHIAAANRQQGCFLALLEKGSCSVVLQDAAGNVPLLQAMSTGMEGAVLAGLALVPDFAAARTMVEPLHREAHKDSKKAWPLPDSRMEAVMRFGRPWLATRVLTQACAEEAQQLASATEQAIERSKHHWSTVTNNGTPEGRQEVLSIVRSWRARQSAWDAISELATDHARHQQAQQP